MLAGKDMVALVEAEAFASHPSKFFTERTGRLGWSSQHRFSSDEIKSGQASWTPKK